MSPILKRFPDVEGALDDTDSDGEAREVASALDDAATAECNAPDGPGSLPLAGAADPRQGRRMQCGGSKLVSWRSVAIAWNVY